MSESKVAKENINLHEEEAKNYEDQKSEIYNKYEQNRITSVLGRAFDYIETGTDDIRVLDLGCGTGNIIEKLIPRAHKIIGVDLSEDMLCKAYSKYGDNNGLNLVRGKASSLPFEDNFFDVITSYSVLHHFHSFETPISEISRVLKDGGVVYIDHEPINRKKISNKLYIKLCEIINGKFKYGLPPYDGSDGSSREFCDYQIHNGDGGNGGVPIEKIRNLFEKNGVQTVSSERYLGCLNERSRMINSFLSPFISSEWIFIGKKTI